LQAWFNPFNDGKPVKIARDGQEIEPRVGEELCRIFPGDETIDLIPMLKRMKKQSSDKKSNPIQRDVDIRSRLDLRGRGFPAGNSNQRYQREGNFPLAPQRRTIGREERGIHGMARRDASNGSVQHFDHHQQQPQFHPFGQQRPYMDQPQFQRLEPMKHRMMDRRMIDNFAGRIEPRLQRGDRKMRDDRF